MIQGLEEQLVSCQPGYQLEFEARGWIYFARRGTLLGQLIPDATPGIKRGSPGNVERELKATSVI